jgi:hypothetical protein
LAHPPPLPPLAQQISYSDRLRCQCIHSWIITQRRSLSITCEVIDARHAAGYPFARPDLESQQLDEQQQEKNMVANSSSPFLRRVLLADAVISGATGLLLFLGSGLLAAYLQLPETLLRPAGLFLMPYSLFVAHIATRPDPPRQALWAIIVANWLWAVNSILLLVSGWVTPSALGTAFVIFQAAVVAGFAELQYIGLRQQVRTIA